MPKSMLEQFEEEIDSWSVIRPTDPDLGPKSPMIYDFGSKSRMLERARAIAKIEAHSGRYGGRVPYPDATGELMGCIKDAEAVMAVNREKREHHAKDIEPKYVDVLSRDGLLRVQLKVGHLDEIHRAEVRAVLYTEILDAVERRQLTWAALAASTLAVILSAVSLAIAT